MQKSVEHYYGYHAVSALIEHAPERALVLYLVDHREDERAEQLVDKAKAQSLSVERVKLATLEKLCGSRQHQGCVIKARTKPVMASKSFFQHLDAIEGRRTILLLESVQDPHNMGACLRTALASGVAGVVISRHGGVGLTPTVCKIACGAAESVPVIAVHNEVKMILALKEMGFGVFGTAIEGEKIHSDIAYPRDAVLVMGQEEKGLSNSLRDACDALITIPMASSMASLNLSVATGICLYEVLRQQGV